MRILFLNDLYDPRIGSSIRQMYQEAARLRVLGHEAAVVTATQDRAAVGWTEVLGTPVHRLFSDYPARFRAWKTTSNPAVRAPLRALLAEWRPDVVHTHLIHTHLSHGALTDARAAGAGVVFTAHDVMTFCYQKLTCFHGGEAHEGRLRDYEARWTKCIPCQRLRFRPGRNAALRRILARDVHRFTVVSDELGRAISANGIRVDRTVHNAIELRAELPAPEEAAAFRARHGLTEGRVVTIGGRLHEQKGVGKLLEMLALLQEFPDLRLLVMGREEIYEQGFRARARELGVDRMVVPTGWLDGDELQRAYAATDVLVTPSICFDTFGMVNLEAMEHGKPVVATELGGSPEVVVDGETGFVANPFRVAEFAGRVAALLRDPALRRRLGAAGRARLEERFGIERLTDEFLEEYARARELAAAGRVGA